MQTLFQDDWIYVNSPDNDCRYILGIKGENPLFCFGINPSTAEPGQLDNTMQSVHRLAKFHGFDGWMMLNIYPQRATNPNDIHSALNAAIHQENLKAIEQLLANYPKPSIWAAWGTLIEKRSFLWGCLTEIVDLTQSFNCSWKSIGACSKKGHPHHPLYLSATSPIDDFDMGAYLKKA